VKVLHPDDEAGMCERLQRLEPVRQNHTIPGEIVEGERGILIMPCLDPMFLFFDYTWPLSELLGGFIQVAEVLRCRLLHAHNIAHLVREFLLVRRACPTTTPQDLCLGNNPGLRPDTIYIIDYGASHHFSLGPGIQPTITLPETQMEPPLGLKALDPYSWDVGHISVTWCNYSRTRNAAEYPWVVRRIIQWLFGQERGCTGVCHCRATARQVRGVLTVVRWALVILEAPGKVFDLIVRPFDRKARAHT
ncbi:hypothetical protein C8Q77DRAFT_1065550, partial [Trametes polyzona]